MYQMYILTSTFPSFSWRQELSPRWGATGGIWWRLGRQSLGPGRRGRDRRRLYGLGPDAVPLRCPGRTSRADLSGHDFNLISRWFQDDPCRIEVWKGISETWIGRSHSSRGRGKTIKSSLKNNQIWQSWWPFVAGFRPSQDFASSSPVHFSSYPRIHMMPSFPVQFDNVWQSPYDFLRYGLDLPKHCWQIWSWMRMLRSPDIAGDAPCLWKLGDTLHMT